MKRNRFIIIIILLCVLGVQGCKPHFSKSSHIFSDQCEPPCWGGITPGESSIFDAYNKIVVLEYIDPRSFYFKDRRPDGGISLHWDFDTSEYGIVYQDNGTVSEILFQCMKNLPLIEIINKLGKPDEYFAGGYSGGDTIVHRILIVSKKGYIAGMTLSSEEYLEAKKNGVPIDHTIDTLIYYREGDEELAMRRYMMNTYFEKMERFPWE